MRNKPERVKERYIESYTDKKKWKYTYRKKEFKKSRNTKHNAIITKKIRECWKQGQTVHRLQIATFIILIPNTSYVKEKKKGKKEDNRTKGCS